MDASKSGAELCSNCHKRWDRHKGKQNSCDYMDTKDFGSTFEGSGRVDEPEPRSATVEHHHHPAYIPPRPKCDRCHDDHPTRYCDRVMA